MHGHHPCCMGSGIGRVGMPMVGARTGITFSYLHKVYGDRDRDLLRGIHDDDNLIIQN